MEKLKQLNSELQKIQERLERTDFDVSEKLQNIIDDISNLVEARVSPKVADRKMVAHIINNTIRLQEANYIEDGCFIEIDGSKITLYEIPLYGGNPILIGEYKTIIEAIAKTDELT